MTLLTIHQGSVVLEDGSVDGDDTGALNIIGDTGSATVSVLGGTYGANRYDGLGDVLSTGSRIVQVSQQGIPAPGRATVTLSGVAFSPHTETDVGGKSILVGSSDQALLTETSLSFVGVGGTPATAYFEDFPTTNTLGNIATAESVSTVTAKASITIGPLGNIATAEDVQPLENVASRQIVTPNSVVSAESVASIGGVARGAITASLSGIATAESVSALTIVLPAIVVHPNSVTTSESVGDVGILNRGITSLDSVASAESVGDVTVTAGAVTVTLDAVASAESVGDVDTQLHEIDATGPPESVTPGLLRPSGDTPVGETLVSTFGEWQQATSETRFVWSADGVVVRDTGWTTDTYNDEYTVQHADEATVVTVDQYARNSFGEAGPITALGQAHVPQPTWPTGFADHTAVFGPMKTLPDVWSGLKSTLKTWLPTYLRERERISGRAYGALPSIRGWRIFARELDSFPADQLPLCVIVAPGVPDALTRGADGLLHGTLEVGVSIVVRARSTDETLALAGEYGAALRSCLSQHRGLGGVASGMRIIGERYDDNPLGAEDQRTIAIAELVVSIRLDGISQVYGGPAEPFPDPAPPDDPGGPVLAVVGSTSLDINREE